MKNGILPSEVDKQDINILLWIGLDNNDNFENDEAVLAKYGL